jgi:hypothetical protein
MAPVTGAGAALTLSACVTAVKHVHTQLLLLHAPAIALGNPAYVVNQTNVREMTLLKPTGCGAAATSHSTQ